MALSSGERRHGAAGPACHISAHSDGERRVGAAERQRHARAHWLADVALSKRLAGVCTSGARARRVGVAHVCALLRTSSREQERHGHDARDSQKGQTHGKKER